MYNKVLDRTAAPLAFNIQLDLSLKLNSTRDSSIFPAPPLALFIVPSVAKVNYTSGLLRQCVFSIFFTFASIARWRCTSVSNASTARCCGKQKAERPLGQTHFPLKHTHLTHVSWFSLATQLICLSACRWGVETPWCTASLFESICVLVARQSLHTYGYTREKSQEDPKATTNYIGLIYSVLSKGLKSPKYHLPHSKTQMWVTAQCKNRVPRNNSWRNREQFRLL